MQHKQNMLSDENTASDTENTDKQILQKRKHFERQTSIQTFIKDQQLSLLHFMMQF